MQDNQEDRDGLFGTDEGNGMEGFEPSFSGKEKGEFEEIEEKFSDLPPEDLTTPSEPVEETQDSGKEEGHGKPSEEKKKDSDSSGRLASSKNTTPAPKKKRLTPRKKKIRVMLKRAGLKEPPKLDILMSGKKGTKMRIRDIAIFIKEPEDEVLKGVYEKCPLKNIVNLSTTVSMKRVISVGSQVFNAMRMFQPIQVICVKEEDSSGEIVADNIQCSSGRHRLAFLAMVYGPDAEIPVYVETMGLNEARDAVVVANQARPTNALEKAEHAVLRAVSGNADARQEEIYNKMVTTKGMVPKYCTYSVVERNYPKELSFIVNNASRAGGALTTIRNLNGFWRNASRWNSETKRDEFDQYLTEMVGFLNEFTDIIQKEDDFEPSLHMSAMALQAIGKCYKTLSDTGGEPPKAAVISNAVMSLGDELGRQKAEATYDAMMRIIRA